MDAGLVLKRAMENGEAHIGTYLSSEVGWLGFGDDFTFVSVFLDGRGFLKFYFDGEKQEVMFGSLDDLKRIISGLPGGHRGVAHALATIFLREAKENGSVTVATVEAGNLSVIPWIRADSPHALRINVDVAYDRGDGMYRIIFRPEGSDAGLVYGGPVRDVDALKKLKKILRMHIDGESLYSLIIKNG